MKQKFKKIMSVVGSVCLVGSTIGLAFAAGGAFPGPFVQNNNADYAIVYGANAAASDATGSNSINAYLNTFYSNEVTDTSKDTTIVTGDFSSSAKVIYDENTLGSLFSKNVTDNKVSSLIDYDFRWDNGINSKQYDVHEEIILNDLEIQTTLDDSKLNTSVVLENNKALGYKYIFDDALNLSLIGTEDADELYLTILGKEYEILEMDTDSITVSLSKEESVNVGEVITVDEVTLTVNDIYEAHVEVNGVLIKEGRKKTVDGIEIYVDTVAYHSGSSTFPSRAILKVGKDIEQTFDNGDEYVEEDETWEWHIENPGNIGGFIGVKYNRQSIGFDEDNPEDNAITIGQSYILPENYGAVSFDELTNVTYEDFELSFDDKKLYTGIGTNGDYADVAILEGENDDSIIIGGIETDSLYFKYNESNIDNVEMYFKDINGDVDPDKEGRIQFKQSFSFDVANTTKSHLDIARLVVDDTELKVGLILENSTINDVTLTLTNPEGKIISIPLGVKNNDFKMLGEKDKNAESEDIVVDGKNIGTKEDNIMDHYGTIIKNPESNADDDEVILHVPSEQVYATISIKGQGEEVILEPVNGNETAEVPQLGGIIVKDTEIDSVKNKNLIIVGGSCINAEAARLLGGKACGEEFTLKTGVTAGKAVIQTFASPYDASKVAIVVAGYDAADTTRAVNKFIDDGNLDVSLSKKITV